MAVPATGMNAQTATVATVLREAARRLKAAGVDTPELDARRLLEAAAGVTPEAVLRDPDHPLDAAQQARLAHFIARRGAREPVSRIVGQREFYGRRFIVTPATLDPRPESETLIEVALSLVPRHEPVRILDICTGGGCLLLTLLAELPLATGIGSDISSAAIEVARRNACVMKLETRAQWVEADLTDGIAGTFDLIVANPPYIPSGAIAGLAPEVRLHDPWLALDGGPDGLEPYRRIVADAGRLAPRGVVVLELGTGQQQAVEAIIGAAQAAPGAGNVTGHLDLARHTRCVSWKPRH